MPRHKSLEDTTLRLPAAMGYHLVHILRQRCRLHHGLYRALPASRARMVHHPCQPLQLCLQLGRPYSRYRQRGCSPEFVVRMTIWPFIGLNCLVFSWWSWEHYRSLTGTFKNTPEASYTDTVDKLRKHYTLSLENLHQGRWYTLLTSAVSHNNLPHLAFNMISFHAFTSCAAWSGLGLGTIWTLCLGSAVSCGVATVLDWQRKGLSDIYALGASGIVSGVGAAMACMVPLMPFRVFFLPIDIPLWMLTLGYIGYDSYSLKAENTKVGHAGHLGGAAFGVLFYTIALRRFGGVSDLWRFIARFGLRRKRLDVPPPLKPRGRNLNQPAKPLRKTGRERRNQ
ncbi:hypothetical protein GGS23DRAFT_589047 [Durotheca rogersii]|uniref:uncharacterized protein n=1 Tax=Durotheca rogersii TaxID=419775 RepID=UPI00221FE0C4|nr:uncharacterized protein GGS23DRAFT_589047 [Durotheca rogersii]KAI5856217.1 hypothetical protein GGS23DRAFT_589047 [Durotheca rogersii]